MSVLRYTALAGLGVALVGGGVLAAERHLDLGSQLEVVTTERDRERASSRDAADLARKVARENRALRAELKDQGKAMTALERVIGKVRRSLAVEGSARRKEREGRVAAERRAELEKTRADRAESELAEERTRRIAAEERADSVSVELAELRKSIEADELESALAALGPLEAGLGRATAAAGEERHALLEHYCSLMQGLRPRLNSGMGPAAVAARERLGRIETRYGSECSKRTEPQPEPQPEPHADVEPEREPAPEGSE